MNTKAFQLVISTLIIILGLFVLISIILTLTGYFKKFKATSDSYFDTAEATAVKHVCLLACENQDRITFCCSKQELGDGVIKCQDQRLEIVCDEDCENFVCEGDGPT